MRRRRNEAELWLVASVAAAGALLGHGVGYTLGGAGAASDHGHLSLLAPLLSVAAGAACLVLAVRLVRGSGAQLALRTLLAGHVVAYLLLETVEATLSSPVAHLSSPGFLAGLAAQPVVALGIARLLRVGTAMLARALALAARPVAATSRRVALRHRLGVTGVAIGAPARRRGPPLVLAR